MMMEDVGVDAKINLYEASPTDLPSVMMFASLSSGELSSLSYSSEENALCFHSILTGFYPKFKYPSGLVLM